MDYGTYTASSSQLSFGIDSADATKLQPGSIYRFRSYAVNSLSIPSYSTELRIAAARLPGQPASAPQRIISISNTTAIAVSWNKVADTEVPTTGYKLYRDGGNDGQFALVYDGTHRPGQLAFISTGLKTGTFYRFKVHAINFNGDGPESEEAVLPA